MNKKKIIRKYGTLLSAIYRLLNHNSIKIAPNNEVSIKGVFMKNCQINIVGGGNKLIIKPGLTRLMDCKIHIYSSDCSVIIGKDSNLNETSFHIEDRGGFITIGEHVTICGKTNLSVIEGKSIRIGNDCLFSANIQIRVGDSHSILDTVTGNRINPSKDVEIGNHVWIGNSVDILKGAKISDNTIVGTRSVVTGSSYPPNCVIGGVPAKILKQEVSWHYERL